MYEYEYSDLLTVCHSRSRWTACLWSSSCLSTHCWVYWTTCRNSTASLRTFVSYASRLSPQAPPPTPPSPLFPANHRPIQPARYVFLPLCTVCFRLIWSFLQEFKYVSFSQQYRSQTGSSANQSPTSPLSNQGFSPGGSPQVNITLLWFHSSFDDFV